MKKINYANMFTHRADGRYQGYYYQDGKRKFVYDKDPERLFNRLQELTSSKPVTYKDVALEWETMHREEISNGTWKNYKPHFEAAIDKFGSKYIESIEPADISAELMRYKAQGYSRTVVNSVRSIHRMIFDYAIMKGYIKYNPADIKLPKGLPTRKREAPTDEQMKKIIQTEHPFRLFPLLLLCTGLRKGEALALTWDDIDFKKNVIHVTKTLDYKGGGIKVKPPKSEAGIRDVVMIPLIKRELETAHKRRKSSLLFPKPANNRDHTGGNYYSLRAFEGAWERYITDMGFIGENRVTAHMLRHGTATLMFEAGIAVKTTQHTLGHSRPQVTEEIYTDLRGKKQAQDMAKLADHLSDMCQR